jgi:alkylated DNA repair dioxygenase AlkB
MKRKADDEDSSVPLEDRAADGLAPPLQPTQPPLWPKGVVHLTAFLPLEEQWDLLTAALQLGSAAVGGFELARNERTKHMLMMHVGRRTEGPGSHRHAHVPVGWQAAASRALAAARAQDASLPDLHTIDVCVVNLYAAASRLSPHVDVLTRHDPGAPIVSLSLGLACDFCFQKGWGKKHKLHTVNERKGFARVAVAVVPTRAIACLATGSLGEWGRARLRRQRARHGALGAALAPEQCDRRQPQWHCSQQPGPH